VIFIDVEGGGSTLIVTPAGQSLLIDAGYGGRGGRDPARILAAADEAGIDRIDYLLITHFHNDHVGGVPELASSIPIGTFIDYGLPLGTDRMANGGFRAYEPVRGENPHIQPRPGDRLPLDGIEADIVSAGGMLPSAPLGGGGRTNDACANVEDHPEDGTENFQSIGVMLQFGSFRFLALGELSGNTLTRLMCPVNPLGKASVYLVAHHRRSFATRGRRVTNECIVSSPRTLSNESTRARPPCGARDRSRTLRASVSYRPEFSCAPGAPDLRRVESRHLESPSAAIHASELGQPVTARGSPLRAPSSARSSTQSDSGSGQPPGT